MELVRASPRSLPEWRQAISAIETFIPEAVMHFTSEGVKIRSVDPSQVVFVDFFAPKQFFVEYKVASPDIPVPVNLSEMVKVLSRIGAEYSLTMSVEDVEMRIIARSPKGVTREFVLPLIDVSEQVPPVSEIHGARVIVPGRILKDAIKDVGLFASSVLFQVVGGKVILEGKGSTGASKVVLSGIRVEGSDVASRYSLPYLLNISKFLPVDEDVTLIFSTDSPLKISFRLGEVTLSYLLAHMIL